MVACRRDTLAGNFDRDQAVAWLEEYYGEPAPGTRDRSGLRATAPLAQSLEAGTEVRVEITVQDAADARHPPLVNLQGRGRVVRAEPAIAAGTCTTALQFIGALSLREPFAQMLLF